MAAFNSDMMRHRCQVVYPVATQDSATGQDVITWTTLGTRWGELVDDLPSRSESVQQGLEVARNQSRLRMLPWSAVTSAMRVIIEGVTYEIVGGPSVIGHKDGIEMMLEKVSTLG